MGEQLDIFNKNTTGLQTTPSTVYKTVPMTSKELDTKKAKHRTQSADVLAYFTRNQGKKFTAWQVLHGLGWAEKRRSSMGRVFSNLCDTGQLMKTTETRREQEGVNNYLYTLPIN